MIQYIGDVSIENSLLIEEFVTYFVDTWFEGPLSVGFWNVSNTIGPRTNNHVEGFHHKLNNWINRSHPDVYQLINIFKLIETGVSVDYTARLIGFSEPKRKAIDLEKDRRYENIKEHLKNNVIDIRQFLRSCSYLINFNNIMNMI